MSQADVEVIMERLNNFIEANKEEHREIKCSLDKMAEDHEKRIKNLEDWKLVFVAKFTTWTAVALFFGSLVGNLLIKYISDKLI